LYLLLREKNIVSIKHYFTCCGVSRQYGHNRGYCCRPPMLITRGLSQNILPANAVWCVYLYEAWLASGYVETY